MEVRGQRRDASLRPSLLRCLLAAATVPLRPTRSFDTFVPSHRPHRHHCPLSRDALHPAPAFPAPALFYRDRCTPRTDRQSTPPLLATLPRSTRLLHEPFDGHDAASSSQDAYRTLLSYLRNCQRVQREGHRQDRLAGVKTVKSLLLFLRSNTYQDVPPHSPITTDPVLTSSMPQLLSKTLVQAMRIARDAGDYRTVLNLAEAAIEYADGRPVLSPRIFGEAVSCLSHTAANISKLKKIWSMVSTKTAPGQSCLSHDLTSHELNVMLLALASRGKTGACLDILAQHHPTYRRYAEPNNETYVPIEPDEYTVAAVLNILTESVTTEQTRTFAPTAESDSLLTTEAAKIRDELRLSTDTATVWQWNEALQLIGTIPIDVLLNNHVVASLLKCSDAVRDVTAGRHDCSVVASTFLQSMIDHGVYPDAITCTAMIRAFGDASVERKGRRKAWKDAERLFQQMNNDSNYPRPNVYTYSAMITTLGQANQGERAIALFRSMIESAETPPPPTTTMKAVNGRKGNIPPRPNTYVYNAFLKVILRLEDAMSDSDEKLRTALSTLTRMIQHANDQNTEADCSPDTTTFNTVLSIHGLSRQKRADTGDTQHDALVTDLLSEMDKLGITKNDDTYRIAMQTMIDPANILETLATAISKTASDGSDYHGEYESHRIFEVHYSALNALVGVRSIDGFRSVLESMRDKSVSIDERALKLLFQLFQGSSQHIGLPELLEQWDVGDDEYSCTERRLGESSVENETTSISSLDLRGIRELFPSLRSEDYAMALSLCLAENDLEAAQQVFVMMRRRGMAITVRCIEEFVIAYAKSSVEHAKRRRNVRDTEDEADDGAVENDTGRALANKALHIACILKPMASFHVLGAVARACASNAMWTETRGIITLLHRHILDLQRKRQGRINQAHRRELELMPRIHRTVLRQAAYYGDVTAALRFIDDLERTSQTIRNTIQSRSSQVTKQSCASLAEDYEGQEEDDAFVLGMISPQAEHWVQLIVAASKANDWKVCVRALQSIRPSVQRVRSRTDVSTYENQRCLGRYQQVGVALNSAARCLEQHSQGAWSVRIVDDWMEWSNRRPPLEAVLSTCRVLSGQGLGDEVIQLIDRCLSQPADSVVLPKGVIYDRRLYVSAATTLHRHGLYDSADDLFIKALKEGFLTMTLERVEDSFVLDLHGFNVALAHCAVRVALRQQYAATETGQGSSQPEAPTAAPYKDMIIVTGRGRHSAIPMKPVLRPEVQRMLLEEFYPPLNTMSLPDNMGALRVLGSDIAAWQAEQSQQKAARMQTVASVLKGLSSVSRIQRTIELAASRSASGAAGTATKKKDDDDDDKSSTEGS